MHRLESFVQRSAQIDPCVDRESMDLDRVGISFSGFQKIFHSRISVIIKALPYSPF